MTVTPAYDHLVLNDPEMMLATDFAALRTVPRITAIGTFTVTVDSPEQLMHLRTRLEAELAAKVQDYQKAISSPGYVLIEWTDTLNIYGELVDAMTAYGQERASGADHAEAKLLRRRILNAEGRGWFWGRFYSSAEPDGELGCTHRAHIAHALTRDEFETARQELWP